MFKVTPTKCRYQSVIILDYADQEKGRQPIKCVTTKASGLSAEQLSKKLSTDCRLERRSLPVSGACNIFATVEKDKFTKDQIQLRCIIFAFFSPFMIFAKISQRIWICCFVGVTRDEEARVVSLLNNAFRVISKQSDGRLSEIVSKLVSKYPANVRHGFMYEARNFKLQGINRDRDGNSQQIRKRHSNTSLVSQTSKKRAIEIPLAPAARDATRNFLSSNFWENLKDSYAYSFFYCLPQKIAA